LGEGSAKHVLAQNGDQKKRGEGAKRGFTGKEERAEGSTVCEGLVKEITEQKEKLLTQCGERGISK